MAEHRSGGWRNGDGEDPFPPLPRNPVSRRTPLREVVEPLSEQLFEGPIGLRVADNIAALVTRADQHGEDMAHMSRDVFAAFERSDKIQRGMHEALQELKVVVMGKPRPEQPSSVDLVRDASKSFGELMKERAQRTPGPDVVGKPEEFEALAAQVFAEKMASYEEAKELKERRAQEALEKQDSDRRAADRRTFWTLTVSGIIVAMVGIGATYFITKATEHASGFVEGVKAGAVPATH